MWQRGGACNCVEQLSTYWVYLIAYFLRHESVREKEWWWWVVPAGKTREEEGPGLCPGRWKGKDNCNAGSFVRVRVYLCRWGARLGWGGDGRVGAED